MSNRNLQLKYIPMSSAIQNQGIQPPLRDKTNLNLLVEQNQHSIKFKSSEGIIDIQNRFQQPHSIKNHLPSNLPIIYNTFNPSKFNQHVSQNRTNVFFTAANNNILIPHTYKMQVSNPLPNIQVKFDQNDRVSKLEYEKIASECKNWEIKYDQLYLKYSNTLNNKSRKENQSKDNQIYLQNQLLKQKLISLQQKERNINTRLQGYLTDLINKYKLRTLQQCRMVLQRYKFQSQKEQK